MAETRPDTSVAAWRKSRFCNGASACVEVAILADGNVALRDSKDPDGLVHRFTRSEWDAFVAGVRAGEFDPEALKAPSSDSAPVASDGDAPSATQKPSLAFVEPSQVSR